MYEHVSNRWEIEVFVYDIYLPSLRSKILPQESNESVSILNICGDQLEVASSSKYLGSLVSTGEDID